MNMTIDDHITHQTDVVTVLNKYKKLSLADSFHCMNQINTPEELNKEIINNINRCIPNIIIDTIPSI